MTDPAPEATTRAAPEATTRHTSFAPVVDANTRVLVLGSLPGVASLAAARYYAHPQNAFWRLVGGVIGIDVAALPYDERLAGLCAAGVGLWDVVATARRAGSLDAALREVRGNDLAGLVTTLRLRLVAFNGHAAATIGTRTLPPDVPHVTLPSSSPANTMPFAMKAAAWRVIGDALAGQ